MTGQGPVSMHPDRDGPVAHAIDLGAHTPVVRYALRRLGVPAELLDDAVQDVFTVVVRRERDFERDRSLTNWLWGIARGVASTHRRALGRRARLHAALAVGGDDGPTVDDALARAEASARVAAFVERLPTALREVFVLAHLQGHSGPEIAARLGINLNTAYARIRSTRLRLEAELLDDERRSLGARIMRAFAPLFAASSKSIATAGMTASLVWIGVRAPLPVAEVSALVAATGTPTSAAAATDLPRSRPPRTRPEPVEEPRMIPRAVPNVAIDAALVTTPVVAAAAPARATRASVRDGDGDDAARRDGVGNVRVDAFVEGDRLEGQVLRPEGADVVSSARVKFPSLIALRGDFMPELVHLAKDL